MGLPILEVYKCKEPCRWDGGVKRGPYPEVPVILRDGVFQRLDGGEGMAGRWGNYMTAALVLDMPRRQKMERRIYAYSNKIFWRD